MSETTAGRVTRPYCPVCKMFCGELLLPDAWSADAPGAAVQMNRVRAEDVDGVTAYCGRCLDTLVIWQEMNCPEPTEKSRHDAAAANLDRLIEKLREPINEAWEAGDLEGYEQAVNELSEKVVAAVEKAAAPPFVPTPLSAQKASDIAWMVGPENRPFLFYVYEPHAEEWAAEIVKRFNAFPELLAAGLALENYVSDKCEATAENGRLTGDFLRLVRALAR